MQECQTLLRSGPLKSQREYAFGPLLDNGPGETPLYVAKMNTVSPSKVGERCRFRDKKA